MRSEGSGQSYLAARGEPVADGEQREAQRHHQHHQALDGDGLLPQARQVLIPDRQQLLLAVRMGHKLQGTGDRETGG